MEISSKSNEKIKNVSKLLSSSKKRSESGLFVVEGLRLCYDAILSGLKPVETYYTKKCLEKNSAELEHIIKNSQSVFEVSNDVFLKISQTVNPQGIVCVVSNVEKNIEVYDNLKLVVLENIADPSNLGAVSRTAEALGINGIIVVGGCDEHNPKALRASMGALFRLPVVNMSLEELFEFLNSNHIKSYASTPADDALDVNSINFEGKSAMFIGNEANGLTAETLNKCEYKIKILMSGRAESLNAAAAASILIYCMTLGA